MIAPTTSAEQSMTQSSTGSTRSPSISLVMTAGRDDLELVALAPHRLDEDREVQLAATAHIEDVRGRAVLNAQRDVGEQLALQPRAQLP